MIELFCDDAIQGMTQLKSDSIQCIITSLPWYGENCSFIPLDVELFRKSVLAQFSRILKPNGVVCWDSFNLKDDLPLLHDWNILSCIQWGISHLIVFSKSLHPFFNNPYGDIWDIPNFKAPVVFCLKCGCLTDGANITSGNRRTILWAPCSCGSDDYGMHPSPFPEEIPTRCILMGSKEGDTILDPFCGSGTTGVAGVKLNRDVVLIDHGDLNCYLSARRMELLGVKC